MFVTSADFSDIPYRLPGLDAPGASDTFPLFVANAEDEWLRKLVGNLFYDALVAGVGALPADWSNVVTYHLNGLAVSGGKVWKSLSDPNLNHVPVEGVDWTANPNPTVDRWLKLRDGENYQVASITNCPTFKWVGMRRLVQPLVYSLWLKATVRTNTGQGVVVAANENSELVNPGIEITRAWNRYYQLAVTDSTSRLSGSVANSFFGYLVAKAADFNNVITDGSYTSFLTYILNQFNSPGRMNIFDI